MLQTEPIQSKNPFFGKPSANLQEFKFELKFRFTNPKIVSLKHPSKILSCRIREQICPLNAIVSEYLRAKVYSPKKVGRARRFAGEESVSRKSHQQAQGRFQRNKNVQRAPRGRVASDQRFGKGESIGAPIHQI